MNEKIQVEERREPVHEIGYTFLFELDDEERERRMRELKERLARDRQRTA